MTTLSSTLRIHTDTEVGVAPEFAGDRSTSSRALPPQCLHATQWSAGEGDVCADAESVAWSPVKSRLVGWIPPTSTQILII